MSKKHKHNNRPSQSNEPLVEQVNEEEVLTEEEPSQQELADEPQEEPAILDEEQPSLLEEAREEEAEASKEDLCPPEQSEPQEGAELKEQEEAPAQEEESQLDQPAEPQKEAEQEPLQPQEEPLAENGQEVSSEGDESQPEPQQEELTEEQKAEQEADAAEKARKKALRAAKTREWFKKHVALVVSLCVVVLLAAGLATGHFVTTRNVAFIHSAEDLEKAIAKGKKTEYIFKNDIIWTGDLNLGAVNLDLNKHTLEVKGNLKMEGNGFVGYKKFIWSKPQVGGKVLVEGKLDLTGTRSLYSAFTVGGQVGGIDLNVYGNLSAPSVILSGNLDVQGKVDGTVSLGGNANVSGEVTAINGGKEVVAHGKIGFVSGAEELYVYPESEVAAYSDIDNSYFVEYLEAPKVYLSKDNGKQLLVISHVRNADRYSIEISGISEAFSMDKAAGDNTQFVLPDLDPGDYTVTVKPVSNDSKRYVTRDASSIRVSYFVQLATPVFGIDTSLDENNNRVVTLTIAPVEHAASFVVSVGGTERRVNAAVDAVTLDISDLITQVGTYNVIVYAVQPRGNYNDSERALKSYVYTATANISAKATKTEAGIQLDVDCISGQAFYYLVEWQVEGEAKSLTFRAEGNSTSYLLADLDVTAVSVTPLTKGYYEAGSKLNLEVGTSQPEPEPEPEEEEE